MDNKKKSNKKLLCTVLFAVYLAFLIYFLFFSDLFGRTIVHDEYRYNITPFLEIKRFWRVLTEGDCIPFLVNVCGNVILFIPFGYMFGVFIEGRETSPVLGYIDTFVAAFLLCLTVETCQLMTRVGVFDVDDLMLNVSGAVLGYAAFRISRRMKKDKGKGKA